jgi:chemotaxis protein MotB
MASNNQPIIIKKIKKGGHGHHGGAWKVAFADFVTAMMAFFMVMWIIGLSQQQRSLIQAYFNDPVGFSKNPPKADFNMLTPNGPSHQELDKSGVKERKVIENQKAIDEAKKTIQKAIDSDPKLKELAQKGALVLELTPSGLVLELIQAEKSGDTFFEIGQAVIKPSAIPVLAKVARALADSGNVIKIQGHTDARPYPSTTYDNYSLSADRANAVRRVLMANGVSDDQIGSVDAYADRVLRVPSDPYSQLNRRVSILIPYQEAQAGVDLPADDARANLKDTFNAVQNLKPNLP